MDFFQELKGSVSDTLPHLNPDEVDGLLSFLKSQGVKKGRDLRHITVAILKEKLDLIDSSELFEEWQKAYGSAGESSTTTRQTEGQADQQMAGPSGMSRVFHTDQIAGGSGMSRGVLMDVANSVMIPKMPTFDVNSPYFPSKVREAIRANKRADPRSREEMVARIVDRCREVVPNLERANFNTVAESIVKLYPKSFKDTVPVSDHGSDSLADQLKNKFDNDRRPVNSKTGKENQAPAIKESYGCNSWSPALPSGETESSQTKLMTELKHMSTLAKKDLNWRTIKCKMEDSFYLQRKHINGDLPDQVQRKRGKKRQRDSDVADNEDVPSNMPGLKSDWPFLFTIKGMETHFKLLTDVDFGEKLSTYMSEEADNVYEYLATKSKSLALAKRKMERSEKQGCAFARLAGLLLMLVEHFGDDIQLLVRFTEKTSSWEDMKTYSPLPAEKTPVLVIAGDSLYDNDKVYFFVDNTLVAAGKNIQDAFSLLFMSFFVFNIFFPPGLSCLLCFTQRVIAQINPSKGTKCLTPSITKKSNEKVVKLQNKVLEYKEADD
ncbi:uncharacterized protein LOC117653660 [Thrips palmi]|uniref:Uncharacterized protein LOC117653660 n=1 Tax=Thrips palmi TaxID=161013 RepID=A0A6P9AB49_THRPL|nr:uncharacterized protein LOC117653660 [Thrips palmi]